MGLRDLSAKITALKIGEAILGELQKKIGEKEFEKMLKEPIKGCSCGFIKDGDDSFCPKCENIEERANK